MTMLQLESFDDDHYGAKWDTYGNPGVLSIGYGRNGYGYQMNSLAEWFEDLLTAGQEHATIITGMAFQKENTVHGQILSLRSDAAATEHIRILTQADWSIAAYRGATLLGASAANTIQLNVYHYIEVKAVLHDTTGSVVVRVDGVAVLTLTGIDTKNAGTKVVFDAVRFYGGGHGKFDDIYICNGAGAVNNDFLGDCNIYALTPNGDGNYSQLLGSDGNRVANWQLVDEAPVPVTTDYVGSAVVGEIDTYSFTDLPVAAGSVPGLQLTLYAAKSDAGAKSMRRVVRSTATDNAGADRTLAQAYAAYREILELDPVAAAAWTVASYNATEFGVEVRA